MATILIVDDEVLLTKALCEEVADLGHTPLFATSVEQALKILASTKVEVLLTDLRMAGRDGIELIDNVRQVSPHTRAVAMSGRATVEDYKTITNLGAVDLLTKPFNAASLDAAIRKALECAEGVQAQIHGLSLVDLLQAFGMAKRSVTVKVGETSSIFMQSGEVIHAVSGEETGIDAFKNILFSETPSVQTGPLQWCERSINERLEPLLLDVYVAKDTSDLGIPPPVPPISSITPAEGFDDAFTPTPEPLPSVSDVPIPSSARDVPEWRLSVPEHQTVSELFSAEPLDSGFGRGKPGRDILRGRGKWIVAGLLGAGAAAATMFFWAESLDSRAKRKSLVEVRNSDVVPTPKGALTPSPANESRSSGREEDPLLGRKDGDEATAHSVSSSGRGAPERHDAPSPSPARQLADSPTSGRDSSNDGNSNNSNNQRTAKTRAKVHLDLDSKPSGMELVDAVSRVSLGRTPFSVEGREGENLHVRARQNGHLSPTFDLTFGSSDSDEVLDVRSWAGSLSPDSDAPENHAKLAVARKAPRRTPTAAAKRSEPEKAQETEPTASSLAPMREEPAAPVIGILPDGAKPKIGVIDEAAPDIGVLE